MEPDFSGYATKADLLCSDGRTIAPGAFKHQDKMKVPLVWSHVHNDPENVLGHAILSSREDGMWADAYFNDSTKGQHAKGLVQHGDITMLSIWANELMQRGKKVLHGAIREVSLVISGANPGALIESVTVQHNDGSSDTLDDEAIITTGIEIELHHADGDDDDDSDDDGETVGDIYASMSEKQKNAVNFLIGEAVAAAKEGDEDGDEDLKQDNVSDDDEDDTVQHDNTNTDQEGSTMTHTNVFEKDGKEGGDTMVLSHSDVEGIFASARAGSGSSLKDTLFAYAEEHLEHGIQDLETLFPEATAVTNKPEWDKRRTEWVSSVLGGATKRPFSRIKTWTADITYEQARAKGYIKGNVKKDEWFTIAKRVTGPQTIYKKQKLDRDDIIDITDFDVVVWMKGEMRMMLDEELARAVLVGDGREVADEDKIQEDKIRPIALDDPYYTISIGVDLQDANSSVEEVLDAMILNRQFYKGTGSPNFYTTETFIAQCLLLRDGDGRKLYRSVSEVAAEMRVSSIIAVEVLDEYPDIVGIMVNMSDYSIGADKGGKVTMFDDFDIDFNQEKYLIETRVSGALTKPKSAMVVYSVLQGETAVAPDAPTYDKDTGIITIPAVVGVVYQDGDGNVLAAGPVQVDPMDSLVVQAWPDDAYFFAGGFRTRWSYMNTNEA